MKLIPTQLDDVAVIETPVHDDSRGAFWEFHNARKFDALGLHLRFVQDSVSRSHKNVLRGLHYQEPNAQGKLVGVVAGAIFDVAVDIRVGSPTFGKWIGVELNGGTGRMIWIPPGFAHGFLALTDDTIVAYKVTDTWVPAHEHGIRWNDPEISISWPVSNPVLSLRDATLPSLRNVTVLPSYEPAAG